MELETAVPRQAIMLIVFATAAALMCGHPCGFANVVALGLGATLWLGLATAYRRRRWAQRDHDRRAAICAAAGFGVPLVVSAVLWRTPSLDGLVFSSDAAAFCAVLFTVFFAAILASSMVDWYYVLPKALGIIGAPIWLTNEEAESDERGNLGKERRRGIAQIWIFHRGVCELLTLTSVAFLVAVLLVAAGNALSGDATLPAAIESLGGAGVAFGVLQYVGPRLRDGLNFVLSSPVGLGMWVEGQDEDGGEIGGLVVDVSIAPGVKLVDAEGRRSFIPLAKSHRVSPAGRPRDVTSEDCRDIVLEHLGQDPRRPKQSRFERLRRRLWSESAKSAPYIDEDDARWDAA